MNFYNGRMILDWLQIKQQWLYWVVQWVTEGFMRQQRSQNTGAREKVSQDMQYFHRLKKNKAGTNQLWTKQSVISNQHNLFVYKTMDFSMTQGWQPGGKK